MTALVFNATTLSALGAAALGFFGLVAFLLVRLAWDERYQQRVASLHQTGAQDTRPAAPPKRAGLLGSVSGVGELASSVLSQRTLEEFRHTLNVAGFRSQRALGLLVGGKLLLLVSLPLTAWFTLAQFDLGFQTQMFAAFGAAILGLMTPDLIIRQLRRRHLAALQNGLADALDLLVICSEAGLGLEPALERVGNEIRPVHAAVAEELTHTSGEMRVNADHRLALINMGKRTGVESLRRLGGTMVQSLQYGTPLSHALRVLAAELRQESLNRYEARAGRLSVLLTIPMVAFILPCVFLIVGGPAIVQVYQTFRH